MHPPAPACPAIALARQRARGLRLPLLCGGQEVGSVARAHLAALAVHAPWVRVGDAAVSFPAPLAEDPEALSAVLAASNAALRDAGLIPGWRDETYAIVTGPGAPAMARLERAASRFWGTLTFGAHLNGYVCDSAGRIRALWIARRSLTKATDPGCLDNLVGGGIPHGQSPFAALVRECWEEAGLPAALARQCMPGRTLAVDRDIPEGVQRELIFGYDLALPPGVLPQCMDGEVMAHRLVPVDEVIGLLAGTEMTVDAALVTLDFLLRHGLLPPALAQAWGEAARTAGLFGAVSPRD